MLFDDDHPHQLKLSARVFQIHNVRIGNVQIHNARIRMD